MLILKLLVWIIIKLSGNNKVLKLIWKNHKRLLIFLRQSFRYFKIQNRKVYKQMLQVKIINKKLKKRLLKHKTQEIVIIKAVNSFWK